MIQRFIDNARQKKRLIEKCMDLGNPMMVHLAKLLLFPNSEHEEHWKDEVCSFIADGSGIDPKRGKFNYAWFFEDAKPFTERRSQGFFNKALKTEKNLKAIKVSINDFEALLILFQKELNREFKKIGDILLDEEILEILTICLEGVRK